MAGASPAPPIHGPGGLIRGLVGATLAVALGGGGVWLMFAPMVPTPPDGMMVQLFVTTISI